MKHFTDESNWPQRVAQHNLVYLTPVTEPLDGWAIGNGETGALFWTSSDSLIAVLNRADLIEPAENLRKCYNWSRGEEERTSTQRHGGRVVWRFPYPIFDAIYLKSFRAELDIAFGELRISCASVFGSLQLTAFIQEGGNSLRIKMIRNMKDCSPSTMRLERLGSRVFGHWYRQIRRAPEAGLDGTSCTATEDAVCISKTLTEHSAFALASWNSSGQSPRRISAFAGELEIPSSTMELPGQTDESIVILTPPDSADAQSAAAFAERILQDERNCSWDSQSAFSREAWKSFWSASWLDCGDAYLNQLWHLQMFYLNASQRGRCPARFIGALWNWQSDLQPWHHIFHWNQQMLYWPALSSGHPELLRPYLEWRWKTLDAARHITYDHFHSKGAWVSDVTGICGEPSMNEDWNLTPAGQIAQLFFLYWKSTGDMSFLRERAYPYMLEAARFLKSNLKLQDDGYYHVDMATSYEGGVRLLDTTTTLATIAALLRDILEAADALGLEKNRELLDFEQIYRHLAPYPQCGDMKKFLDREGRRRMGLMAGSKPKGKIRLAAGISPKDGNAMCSVVPCPDGKHPFDNSPLVIRHAENLLPTPQNPLLLDNKIYDGIFPFSEYSVVFPSGLVDWRQKDSQLFDMTYNSLLAQVNSCADVAWDPTPIVLARMGLGDEAYKLLHIIIQYWQYHDNGWYIDTCRLPENALPRYRSEVLNLEKPENDDTAETRMMAGHQFRHVGMEPLGVLGCALDESLLQSHDGIIAVAPAFPNPHGAFTLKSVNGDTISARISDGAIQWIAVSLGHTGSARLLSPWQRSMVNGVLVADDKPLLLNGVPDDYFVVTDADHPLQPDFTLECSQPSPHTHKSGVAHLGIEQLW